MMHNFPRFISISLFLSFTASITDDHNAAFCANEKGDYKTGVGIWKPLAERGDAHAQNALGIIYNMV